MRRLKVYIKLMCKILQTFSGSQLLLFWGDLPWGALLILISTFVNAPCKGEPVALMLHAPVPLYSLVDGLKYWYWVGKEQNLVDRSQFLLFFLCRVSLTQSSPLR